MDQWWLHIPSDENAEQALIAKIIFTELRQRGSIDEQCDFMDQCMRNPTAAEALRHDPDYTMWLMSHKDEIIAWNKRRNG